MAWPSHLGPEPNRQTRRAFATCLAMCANGWRATIPRIRIMLVAVFEAGQVLEEWAHLRIQPRFNWTRPLTISVFGGFGCLDGRQHRQSEGLFLSFWKLWRKLPARKLGSISGQQEFDLRSQLLGKKFFQFNP